METLTLTKEQAKEIFDSIQSFANQNAILRARVEAIESIMGLKLRIDQINGEIFVSYEKKEFAKA